MGLFIKLKAFFALGEQSNRTKKLYSSRFYTDAIKKACNRWPIETATGLRSYHLSFIHLVRCTVLLDKSKANKSKANISFLLF